MEEYDECPVCYGNHGQAFNGVLQLRNPNQDVLDFIMSEIVKAHDRSYCIKTIETDNGVDYHFSSSQLTRKIGKLLLAKFGGELMETARLVTRSRQTSKDLYRVTVLFRIPDFKKGDVVLYKSKEVKVINFGNRVYVQDIKSHKKMQAKYEDIKKMN